MNIIFLIGIFMFHAEYCLIYLMQNKTVFVSMKQKEYQNIRVYFSLIILNNFCLFTHERKNDMTP